MYLQQIQHDFTLKKPGHLHILYIGQWKFGRASRIYITLLSVSHEVWNFNFDSCLVYKFYNGKGSQI